MKPGDMIEWVYKQNNKIVDKGEEYYSSTMNCWIPIDEPSLLISITEEHYVWLNSKGLFHARMLDMDAIDSTYRSDRVIPRPRIHKLRGQNVSRRHD